MAEYNCPACGAKMEIAFRAPGVSEALPDEKLAAVLGTLDQVKAELPSGSVLQAKIQASMDLLKTLNR